jgi:hypothetical protein
MPAIPSLPQAIKTMLNQLSVVDDANITFSKRNQAPDGALPAIVYRITDTQILTVGDNPLMRATVEIDCIAEEGQASQELAVSTRDVLDTGTYNGIVFQSIVNKINNVLQEPEIGNGEETNPFVSKFTVEIFYKES